MYRIHPGFHKIGSNIYLNIRSFAFLHVVEICPISVALAIQFGSSVNLYHALEQHIDFCKWKRCF